MKPSGDREVTADRWRRLQALYHEMLALPSKERSAALAAACRDDPALVAEVQALLDQPESSAGPLAVPAVDAAARFVSPAGQSLIGRRIGAFEIQALLGVGGMGEVYRALDARLGRSVAIKLLPRAFKDDPDRVARFEREARVLASLNHPNIGAVYGLEDAESVKALVMELVEGEDLSERLARGSIPVAEALPIARQIAEAVEAAHERGVIHRDLKPANIKVRPDGTVKVLDFGLAKALEPSDASAGDPTESPTMTARATRIGMILGTAAYMAPEQALGKPVDRRADIWSFGVVLYEMLTGRRAFKGDDVPSTLAAVLSETPSLAALPGSVPPRIRRLIERCLDREPKTRLRDIGEARIEIARAEAGSPDGMEPKAVRGWRLLPAIALPAALVVAAGVVAVVITRGLWSDRLRSTPLESRLAMPLGQSLQFPGPLTHVALARDGRTVAFSATKGSGVAQQSIGAAEIHLRKLDEMTATPLGVAGRSPTFSPDGRWLAFFGDGKLRKIPLGGAAATDIVACLSCDGDWGEDGTIVFGDASDQPTYGIRRVVAAGGPVSVVTLLDRAAGQTHHVAPQVLPGGKLVLFTIRSDGPRFQLAVAPISGGSPRVIAEDALFGRYLGDGVLVFQRGGSLHAARFDETQSTLGDSAPVLTGVSLYWPGRAWASEGGTLIYRPEEDFGRTLLWVDREGHAVEVGAPVQPYSNPRLSPGGDRIAVAIGGARGTSDVWTYDLRYRRLQREIVDVRLPAWAPDGAHLLTHRRTASSEILSLKLDGSGVTETLVRGKQVAWPAFMTRDGRTLVYHEASPYQIMAIDLTTKASRLVVPGAGGRLHPGERWMAYATDLNGREDVFVTSFPAVGARIPVTIDGGREPVWSRDGRELFYRKGTQMFSARVRPGPTISFDPPKLLFDVAYYQAGGAGMTHYDVSPDGRFLMMKVREKEAPYFGVILNWAETLRKAVGKS